MPQASRTIKILLWITTVCAGVTIFTVALIFTQVRGFAQAEVQGRESDAVASCRAELRGDIDVATADVQELILMGLAALSRGDDEQLRSLAEDAPELIDRLHDANYAYRDGGHLAREDPEQFIAECDER